MKFIHTSDWHLGRIRHQKSFQESHELFFQWLIDIINQNDVELLIVSGDIFDNPYPANNVLSFYYRILYDLSKTKLKKIIITGGNHDSTAVLEAPKEILNLINITVIGSKTQNIEDLIIPITINHKIEAVVCAVPFLKEKDVRKSLEYNDLDTRIKETSEGIANFYNTIYQTAKQKYPDNVPIIAMGHIFVADFDAFDNDEINLFIGDLQQIPLKLLPQKFDYFALGHIHNAKIIGKKENIRYSGSPIRLSFIEKNTKNTVVLVDLETRNIQPIEVPLFRDLHIFKGNLSEIEKQISNYQNNNQLKTWAKLEIVEKLKIADIDIKINELKQKYTHIDIVDFKITFEEVDNLLTQKYKDQIKIHNLTPTDIFSMYISNFEEKQKELLLNTFKELVENYLYENPSIELN